MNVLSAHQVEQKLQRIAREIIEQNPSPLTLVGIGEKGLAIADKMATILREVDGRFEVEIANVVLDKKHPFGKIKFAKNIDLKGKRIVLVDDVMNSGKVMMYVAGFLLENDIECMRVMTLVDRKHRDFPITPDYVGLTLSTTLQDYIEVEVKGDSFNVHLK